MRLLMILPRYLCLPSIIAACLLLVSGLLSSPSAANAASIPLDQGEVVAGVTVSSKLFIPLASTGIGQPLSVTPVGNVGIRPTYLTAPPGDNSRLFVTTQFGRVRIVRSGATLPTPFLDITDQVLCCGERGLLSLAFHPNYAQNGYFYVAFVNLSNNMTIVRYKVSSDPDVADADSAFPILTIDHPPNQNHYGGQLQFGPDGYLYISVGDGGNPGDPFNNSQNTESLLGKILRIDVNSGSPYSVPPSNPFVGPGAPLDEIWSWGLRNTWRFSFDTLTGDMWLGDVGQSRWEEVDFEASNSPGGINYGWDCYEGTHVYDGNASQSYCQGKTFVWPVHEYAHSSTTCGVTGGYVYRAVAGSAYYGTYVFGDLCSSNRLFTIKRGGSTFTTVSRSLVLPAGYDLGMPGSFGMTGNGQIYVTDWDDGDVFRIEF